eukprot:294030-Prymnesium_polylepis.3
MHVLAGMGPEQASKGGETVQPPSGGRSTPGRRGFCIGSSQYGPTVVWFYCCVLRKRFYLCTISRDKEQAAYFGDALKRSIKASPS